MELVLNNVIKSRNGLDYLLLEERCSTPIRPTGFMFFIIISDFVNVNDSMNETEYYAAAKPFQVSMIGGPVDDEFDSHVALVKHDLWGVWELFDYEGSERTLVAKFLS